ncbi:MAG: DUF2225 domain-containing protein [Candidatus Magnetomorum sp.]|nr:DUF2225 domain-containing protein [Candidatus Magnetomorum sp.]
MKDKDNGTQTEDAKNQSESQNPFLRANIICPVCGMEHEQIKLKSRLFVKQGRDIDLKPLTILRKKKGLQHIHPQIFFMWHCPFCHYTAARSEYEDPLKDSVVRPEKLKKAVILSYKNDPSVQKVVDLLTPPEYDENMTHFNAVQLYLLAIFQMQMVDDFVNKEPINIGRYALRLAWLFRDIEASESLKKKFTTDIQFLVQTVQDDWPEVPGDEKRALQMSIDFYEKTLTGTSTIKSDQAEVDLVLLISRIYLKLNELGDARKYLERARELLRNFENTRKKARSIPDDDPKKPTLGEMSQMAADGRKMRRYIDEVQGIMDDMRQDKIDDELTRAKERIEKAGLKKADDIRKLLEKEHFQPKIINILAPQTKKKGLFGFFK